MHAVATHFQVEVIAVARILSELSGSRVYLSCRNPS